MRNLNVHVSAEDFDALDREAERLRAATGARITRADIVRIVFRDWRRGLDGKASTEHAA